MKFIIIFSVVLSVGIFNKLNTEPPSVQQVELDSHRPCECSGWFCSAELLCTDKESCTCNCGVFQCKCSCRKDLQSINHSAHVTSEQITRLIDFEDFLTTLGSVKGNNLSAKIKSMRENLSGKNFGGYYSDAEEAENILPSLSNENRQIINAWFEAKGAPISI